MDQKIVTVAASENSKMASDATMAGKRESEDRLKILMVDDKPENLLVLERLLKDLPLDLYKARSGNEALKLTLHHEFALALLDIQMPEMDGYELAELMRQEEKTARIPFIFISAIYTDSINVFEGYEKGAFSYITKPFEPQVLLSKVRFFIDQYNQEKELKLRTEELQQINEELESFSYTVSHDLRAPLRAIDGFSKVLAKKTAGKLDADQTRYLDVIIENVGKMSTLIDDLLDFSRMGRLKKRESLVDMDQLVNEVFEDLTQSYDKNRFRLTLHPLPKLRGDREMMKHVMANLLGNAIKFSSERDQIVIEVGAEKGAETSIYYIRDNGAGFDMEYADKLFGMFQRLHSDDEFEGTGVGLAIVQRIIKRHKGKVWAQSEQGKGATFFFSVPG